MKTETTKLITYEPSLKEYDEFYVDEVIYKMAILMQQTYKKFKARIASTYPDHSVEIPKLPMEEPADFVRRINMKNRVNTSGDNKTYHFDEVDCPLFDEDED